MLKKEFLTVFIKVCNAQWDFGSQFCGLIWNQCSKEKKFRFHLFMFPWFVGAARDLDKDFGTYILNIYLHMYYVFVKSIHDNIQKLCFLGVWLTLYLLTLWFLEPFPIHNGLSINDRSWKIYNHSFTLQRSIVRPHTSSMIKRKCKVKFLWTLLGLSLYMSKEGFLVIIVSKRKCFGQLIGHLWKE